MSPFNSKTNNLQTQQYDVSMMSLVEQYLTLTLTEY